MIRLISPDPLVLSGENARLKGAIVVQLSERIEESISPQIWLFLLLDV